MSHCQHVKGDLDHRVAPPPVISVRRTLCFLMIIKLHSRCWAGNSSWSGPSALEQTSSRDGKIQKMMTRWHCLHLQLPGNYKQLPVFTFESMWKQFSAVFNVPFQSVNLFPPQLVAQSPSEPAIYHHHESLGAASICYFIKRQDKSMI